MIIYLVGYHILRCGFNPINLDPKIKQYLKKSWITIYSFGLSRLYLIQILQSIKVLLSFSLKLNRHHFNLILILFNVDLFQVRLIIKFLLIATLAFQLVQLNSSFLILKLLIINLQFSLNKEKAYFAFAPFKNRPD